MTYYYAQIDGDRIVVSIAHLSTAIDAPHMVAINELDAMLMGKRHNAQTGEFEAVEPVPVPELRQITRLAFLDRFTDAEAVAIDLASMGATVDAASVRRYLSKVNAATFIDLDRADTRAGVQALEAGGLLVEGRALEIMDAPVEQHERPAQ